MDPQAPRGNRSALRRDARQHSGSPGPDDLGQADLHAAGAVGVASRIGRGRGSVQVTDTTTLPARAITSAQILGLVLAGLLGLAGCSAAAPPPSAGAAPPPTATTGPPPSMAPLTPVDELPVPAGDRGQCHGVDTTPTTPQGQARAQAIWNRTSAGIGLVLAAANNTDVTNLYSQYLQHGVMTASRYSTVDDRTRADFVAAPATQNAYLEVQKNLLSAGAARPPALADPGHPTTDTLQSAGVGQNLQIDYSTPGAPIRQQLEPAALLAGDTGSVVSQLGVFDDRRDIVGSYQLIPEADARGVRTRVSLKLVNPTLLVQDSIDFCPGALGPAPGSRLTLPMSQLERTPYPGGGGWARPVLWQGAYPLPSVTLDVTAWYPRNSRRGDDVPDAQPWAGAQFPLDR